MTGSMGVGAVVGGLIGAGRPRTGFDVIISTAICFGLSMLALSLSPTLPIAVASLLVLGGFSVTFLARANATVQLTADPAMRGRVMAFWTMAFLGTTPVGGPIIGFIGEHAGARWGVATGATAAIVSSLWARRALRGVAPLPVWEDRHGAATTAVTAHPAHP
jgi:MFS family permease